MATGIARQEARNAQDIATRARARDMASDPGTGPDDSDDESGAPIILDASTFDVRIHNGMITIHNPGTGQHRTFRVRTQADDAAFAPGKRVVQLLTGPDREDWSAWQSFGFVDARAGVKVWNKYRGTAHETFGRMLSDPTRWAAKGCEFMVEARCRRCGRALTHPESIATGLGPICAGR